MLAFSLLSIAAATTTESIERVFATQYIRVTRVGEVSAAATNATIANSTVSNSTVSNSTANVTGSNTPTRTAIPNNGVVVSPGYALAALGAAALFI